MEPRPPFEPGEPWEGGLLEGWKAIADHLHKTERTVQRWEKSKGLPVRRLRSADPDEVPRVYAYKKELDAWWKSHTDLVTEPEIDPIGPSPPDVPVKPDPVPRPRVRILRLALLVTLLMAAGGLYYYLPPGAKLPTLGVLPFAATQGGAEESRIARGLTEEMMSRLGNLNPGSVLITEDRRSDYTLQGSVRMDESRVAITARLVAAKPQTHVVWGDSWEFERQDLITKEIEIANKIVDEVLQALSLSGSATHQPDNATYEAYLMGRALWSRRTTESLREAVGYFQRAIGTDPKFAPAYAGLADSFSLLGSAPYTGLPPKEAFPQAIAAARKAIQLDESAADAHISLGYAELVYDRNYSAAEREFRRALQLRPNSATAHQYYGYYLTAMGRLEDAIQERKTAQQLEPTSPLMDSALGEAYYQARQFDNTISYNKLSLIHDRSYAVALINLGRAYELKGMYTEALAAYQPLLATVPDDPGLLALSAHVQAVSGKAQLARANVTRLERMRSTEYVPALYIALVYVGLGEKDKAFQWLDTAYDEHCEYLVYLPTEPLADPLRDDPRFPRFIGRLGLKVQPTPK